MKPKETNNITRTLEVGMVKYMIKAHQFGEPNSAEYSDEFSKKFPSSISKTHKQNGENSERKREKKTHGERETERDL